MINLNDKIIKIELKKQGIKNCQFDKFKLYNYNAYDKLITQFKISKKQGVIEFKKVITKGK